jgi:hypothetical protein
MLHKPILSATGQVRFSSAYSIETAIETKFCSERPIDEFVVFGMYGQQGLDVCFGVLSISDHSKDEIF